MLGRRNRAREKRDAPATHKERTKVKEKIYWDRRSGASEQAGRLFLMKVPRKKTSQPFNWSWLERGGSEKEKLAR